MLLNTEIHKQNWIKSMFKYGKWYFISSLLTKGLSILLLPLYTSYLSTEDFGILQSINSVALFLPFVISCCLDSAFGRFYHEYKNDKEKLSLLFSTAFWFVAIYGFFILILVLATSYLWLPKLLNISVFPYAYISFIPVLFFQLAQLGRVFLEQSLETKRITILDVTSALINAGLTVALLLTFNLGVMSMLIGIAASSVFLFLYYIKFFVKSKILQFRFSLSILKKSLIYSIPLMPAMAGSWLAGLSNRLVLAHYSGLSTVGIFSLGYQLAFILYVVGDAASRVSDPLSMSGLVGDKENTKKKISSIALMFWGVMLLINSAVYLFSKEVVAIFATNSYADSAAVLPVIGLVYVLGIQQRFPTQVVLYHKRTLIVTLGSIFMGLINLAANIILVPRFGYMASAWSTVLSSVFALIWMIGWCQSIDKLHYNWLKYAALFSLYIGLIALYKIYFINLEFSLGIILLKTLILLTLAFISLFIIDKSIFEKIYNLIINKIKS